MELNWFLTVISLLPSLLAISRLCNPCAARSAHSRSRLVSWLILSDKLPPRSKARSSLRMTRKVPFERESEREGRNSIAALNHGHGGMVILELHRSSTPWALTPLLGHNARTHALQLCQNVARHLNSTRGLEERSMGAILPLRTQMTGDRIIVHHPQIPVQNESRCRQRGHEMPQRGVNEAGFLMFGQPANHTGKVRLQSLQLLHLLVAEISLLLVTHQR